MNGSSSGRLEAEGNHMLKFFRTVQSEGDSSPTRLPPARRGEGGNIRADTGGILTRPLRYVRWRRIRRGICSILKHRVRQGYCYDCRRSRTAR